MPKAVRDDDSFPDITRSDAWYARALGLIPAGTQTLAKGPGQYVRGVAPKYLARGKGCHVWDVDGNEYIDFQMESGRCRSATPTSRSTPPSGRSSRTGSPSR